MPRQVTKKDIDTHLALLEETPGRIATCTEGIEEEQLRRAPGPRAWSAVDILAHLRACDDVWSHSIYAMLAENEPALPLLDARRWARAARYAESEFRPSHQAFALRRAELVRVLRALPLAAWTRAADIGGRRHTVYSQARRMALHEAEHCKQIEAAIREVAAGE